MQKLQLVIIFLIAGVLQSAGQTTTTFAGKENTSDPWTNYNNSTTTLADAYFYEPEGIAWDSKGYMYITERNKIRLYDGVDLYNRSGKLGDATFSIGYNNATGIAGAYYHPISVVCNSAREAFIVDSENHAIRKLTNYVRAGDGQVASTFAGANPNSGQGTSGHADASGSSARFDTPKGIEIDASGNLYVTDYNNFCIRKISTSGSVTTLAGKAGADGTSDGTGGANVRFGGPYGIAMLDASTLIVTDNWNLTIRKVNITSGSTETICGKNGVLGSKDGSLSEATFKSPKGIAVVNGLIYVADDSKIRVIDLVNKTVSTFAGSGSAGNQDGVGDKAKFGRLGGLSYDGLNTLYATDVYFNVIRKITVDNLAPTAAFTATKKSLQVNEESTLTDVSGGKPATTRKWTVAEQTSGATDNVSIVSGDLNSSSITVKFLATGFYTVSLSVTNEFGNDVAEESPFFNVSTTGSVEQLQNLDILKIYPNPVHQDVVKLQLEKGVFQNAQVELFDFKGSLISSESGIYGASHTFNVRGVESGTYFLVVHSDSFSGAKMIVIE